VVCWRPTTHLQAEAWRPYLTALERLAEKHNRNVLWLPFHRGQDAKLLKDLIAQGLVGEALQQRSRQLEATSPAEAMAVFRSASLVVAMRLHALILAALSGTGVHALSYDPKVQACATELGCRWLDLADASVNANTLLHTWEEAIDQPAPASALMSMRQSTTIHTQMLRQLSS
jgi:polysaccharide pyruvyl transferase WcaK-like protein